jgi:hypothetical protein
MKIIQLSSSIEAQIIGNAVYVYSDGQPEVLHIDGIENNEEDEAHRLIVAELEFLNSASLSSASNFEF